MLGDAIGRKEKVNGSRLIRHRLCGAPNFCKTYFFSSFTLYPNAHTKKYTIRIIITIQTKMLKAHATGRKSSGSFLAKLSNNS